MISRGDKRIALYPSEHFKVTYSISYDHPLLRHQSRTLRITEESFIEELAPARTFTFLKDVEMLRQNGLALGGSLENAIVLGETGVLNNALRFEDEFVRHKILDAVGDLALVGYPVIGHLFAHRAGHALHTEFAAKILEETHAWRFVESRGCGSSACRGPRRQATRAPARQLDHGPANRLRRDSALRASSRLRLSRTLTSRDRTCYNKTVLADDILRVEPLMREIEDQVRDELRRRMLARGGRPEYQDPEVFRSVDRLLRRAADRPDEQALLPEFLGPESDWRLQTHLRFSSHRHVTGAIRALRQANGSCCR